MNKQELKSSIQEAIADMAKGIHFDLEGKAKSFCFRRGVAYGLVAMAWKLGEITIEEFDKYQEEISKTTWD